MKILLPLLAFLFFGSYLHAVEHVEGMYTAKKNMKMPYETIYVPEPRDPVLL